MPKWTRIARRLPHVEAHIRRDLLDRIAVRIHLPPLRERVGDLFLLVMQFLGPTNYRLDFRTWVLLLSSDWPGNVRQLKGVLDNVVDRARFDGPADGMPADGQGGGTKKQSAVEPTAGAHEATADGGPDSVKKPRAERVILPYDYFATEPPLAAVAARVSPDEATAEKSVYLRLWDLLHGWGYKPRERSPRALGTKGEQPSTPGSGVTLPQRMAELLFVSPATVSRGLKRSRPSAEGGEADSTDD